ncbi:nucleotidyltransferase family protein [Streptantibioticus ferralitis]|uniref:Nucleotidyltransferase family protein n=1 Tax=Streptantibioticus ferralitis TaxID=236510 RepID=A0ABT5Z4A1_9ACTN|nr:nucleotidyltransferase family protein [Streptantibioticus ferralitis]MDF2258629.1 nucleotidyltransferase family protein [Streptantibioticus ferralitis]
MVEHNGAEPSVAGLVLAAGTGRRLGGRPKALLAYRGGLLVEHAAGVLRDGGCRPVHVVLGAAAPEVRARATGLDECVLVDNPDWAQGMGSSLRAGLESLQPLGAPAVLVSLVDQPGIGSDAIARVLREAGPVSPGTLAAAAYDGRRGHPALFGADHWPGIIASAAGDQGARAYLKAHESSITLVECGDIAAPYDIDTPADLRLLSDDLSGDSADPTPPPALGATDR